MEDKHDSGLALWSGVKYWLAKVLYGMNGFSSNKATKILKELHLTRNGKSGQYAKNCGLGKSTSGMAQT